MHICINELPILVDTMKKC